MSREFTDATPFPFGRHKDKAIINVPAQYLLWCRENLKLEQGLKDYIESNLQALQQEVKNGRRK